MNKDLLDQTPFGSRIDRKKSLRNLVRSLPVEGPAAPRHRVKVEIFFRKRMEDQIIAQGFRSLAVRKIPLEKSTPESRAETPHV